MSKSRKKPSYLLHKPTGQARVRLNGKDHYLGEYGSPDSREKYDELISEWLSRQGDLSGYCLTVAELALFFLDHAVGYYRKNDKETCEVNNIRIALRPLVRLHRDSPVREFSPKRLKAVRDDMIKRGCVRTSINRQIGRVKRMFRWGVENELVPVEVYTAICTVAGLKRGRSEAKESDGVKPVPQEMIDAVKPFVSRQVWAMIKLQILTGMRPGEVIQMRGCDLNMCGNVWEFRPESHKTEHHGNKRVIFLGPKAKLIVRDFLKTDLAAYLFSPADARREFDERRKENRKTPMTPSQCKRRKKRTSKKKPGKHYTTASYGQAIRKGCENAFDMPKELRIVSSTLPADNRNRLKAKASEWRKQWCWHPHQLRHNAATELRREFGIEATRTVLGHSSLAITEMYAEKDLEAARSIVEQVG